MRYGDKLARQELKKLELKIDDFIEQNYSSVGDGVYSVFKYDLDKVRMIVEDIMSGKTKDEKGLTDGVIYISRFSDFLNFQGKDVIREFAWNYLDTYKKDLKYLLEEELVKVLCRCYFKDRNKIFIEREKFFRKCMNKLATYMNLALDEVEQKIVEEYNYATECFTEHIKSVAVNVDDEIKVEEEETNKSSKIFDYKKMDKHLKENGFEPVRQRGSHKIYTDGEITTVVPQHDLGKGLSLKIQKQALGL